MTTKNLSISPKKLPYYLLLLLLTAGASLILGLLSFGGMIAITPFLPLAVAAFALSVAYEGEVYLQNIKGSLKKLFKPNFLKNHLAKEYLLTHFPHAELDEENCPQFFKDYAKQLKLLHLFQHKELTEESKQRKKKVEKTISDMEKWFAKHLFSPVNINESAYAEGLYEWLQDHNQNAEQDRLKKRLSIFNYVKVFSLLSALFMGLGTTYLIVEAFSVIPLFLAIPFASWPFLIVPMAIIAGAAYGLLTYNAITDMINNDTLNKWYQNIRTELTNGITFRSVFMAVTSLFLIALAITLTVCTAGTWWTIATNSRPLFEWMKKIPSFIMGVLNPIVTGISAIFFNVQNTAESIELIDHSTRGETHILQTISDSISEAYHHIRDTENWLQIINIPRIILKLTITPLRIVLFLGHLISIGLTADRMPGLPKIISALVAIISEGFEDLHYFVGHDHVHHHEEHEHEEHEHDHHEHDHHGHAHHGHEHHEHEHHNHEDRIQNLLNERLQHGASHNHEVDIPTKVLKFIAIPLYALAALWDSLASKMNQNSEEKEVLSLNKAWKKQRGHKSEEEVLLPNNEEEFPSVDWQAEQAIYRIEKYQQTHLNTVWFNTELAQNKIEALDRVKAQIRTDNSPEHLSSVLSEAIEEPIYNEHRFFAFEDKTSTQNFIEELHDRVFMNASGG